MLEQKRQKVRLIQQRKLSELTETEMKDLPDQIPLPLVIGTEVTGMWNVCAEVTVIYIIVCAWLHVCVLW